MEKLVLNAEMRSEKGKNACSRLRSSGFIPATMYSHGKAESIKLQQREFSGIFKGHISESVLINLVIPGSGAEVPVFVKDYQRDPVTGRVLHLDFYRVTADEKIRTNVAVEITGTATGVRKGGILEHIERELEIECFPGDLREKIVLDVTNLEIGESIHVKDIKGVGEILFLADPERVIVAVLSPSKVKEEAAVEPVEAAGTEGEKGAGSES